MLHILPYLLSYIFMVFILQTATGILSEASISMLGLGPYDSVSLGKILNDANRNEALTDGAWWAFAPAMVLITVIAFSLYVLNTSMEGSSTRGSENDARPRSRQPNGFTTSLGSAPSAGGRWRFLQAQQGRDSRHRGRIGAAARPRWSRLHGSLYPARFTTLRAT